MYSTWEKGEEAKSLFATGQNVAPATPVSQKDTDIAVRAITAFWHSDIPKVHLASTFSSLPKEVQDSVEKADQAMTKGIFHPKSNTIWVALVQHVCVADDGFSSMGHLAFVSIPINLAITQAMGCQMIMTTAMMIKVIAENIPIIIFAMMSISPPPPFML